MEVTSNGVDNIDTHGRCLTYFDTFEHLVHTMLGMEGRSDHEVYPFIELLSDYSYTFNVCTVKPKFLFRRASVLHSDVHLETALH